MLYSILYCIVINISTRVYYRDKIAQNRALLSSCLVSLSWPWSGPRRIRDEKSKQEMMAEFATVADAYESDEDMGASSSGGYGTSYD